MTERKAQFIPEGGENQVKAMLGSLDKIDSLSFPSKGSGGHFLELFLRSASPTNPINIYVGSCPDYSYENGLYTHKSVGGGIPLLAQVHMKTETKLMQQFDDLGIPYRYIIMVADVEAEDDYFCQKFANGDKNTFINKCKSSVETTQYHLDNLGLQGELISSSFFQEFGKEKFINTQDAYQAVLNERHETEPIFKDKVKDDIKARSTMYGKMYGEQRYEYLVERDLRTKAQYLALGRLVGENPTAVIINHLTRNIAMLNKRNVFKLPEDRERNQPTLPVIQMTRKVYR